MPLARRGEIWLVDLGNAETVIHDYESNIA
jgi:hypothetical protein